MTQTVEALPQAVTQLNDAIVQTGESQRALVTEMTQYARDEFSRFLNLRLERNGQALDKLQHCSGLPGLLGVQQEWLRDFLTDYAGQNQRMLGALSGVTQSMVATASDVARDNLDRAQTHASEAMHQAGEQFSTMAQDAEDGANYVQH